MITPRDRLLARAQAHRDDAAELRRAIPSHMTIWRATGSEWRLSLAVRAAECAEREDARAEALEREAAALEAAERSAA